MPSTLIIGAGMAGLTAARELTRHGQDVLILDKGRGVGGRMATRRIEQAKADHGAQYFSARTPEFQRLVDQLITDGVVAEWSLQKAAEVDQSANQSRHPRYVGMAGMNAVAKELARTLPVKTNERVVKISAEVAGWVALTESGGQYRADNLLITMPAPQALTLLRESAFDLAPANRVALSGIGYQPCLAVLASLSQPGRIPAPGGIRFDTGDVSWIADNGQKGISPNQPSVTIHASPDFSRTHFDDDPNVVGQMLLNQVREWIPADSIGTVQTHRWRYSLADVRYPEPYLAAEALFPLLFGGDGFGAGNVEGAFTSGLRMAEYLVSKP